MILAFIGTVGAGKTLSMVYEAYKYYLQGYKVYANLKLNFPFTPLNYSRLKEMIVNKEELQNAIMLLDEVHIFIDSRSSMSKRNKLVSFFLLQTRKRNVRLLYTTQHLHQVDKRLRDTTDILVFNKNISNYTSLVKGAETPTYIMQQYVMQWRDDAKPRTRILLGNPVFPLFDTTQIIDMDE